MRLKLVVFDVDGTLVDSQDTIVRSMGVAFSSTGRQPPSRDRILGIVGLSLAQAFEALSPEAGPAEVSSLVDAYRAAYLAARAGGEEGAPLYPGAKTAIEELSRIPDVLLGIATGKARRGLDFVLENHGLTGMFHAIQTADFHPSKPHPAMLEAALSEAAVRPQDAVMLGDTTFDMEMARAAGVTPIGVSWGYHSSEALVDAGATLVLNEFDALPDALRMIWG